MVILQVPKEDAKKFIEEYKNLPTKKCEHCGAEMNCKEMDMRSYILFRALQDRYCCKGEEI